VSADVELEVAALSDKPDMGAPPKSEQCKQRRNASNIQYDSQLSKA